MKIQEALTKQSNRRGTSPQFCKNILATVDLSKDAEVDLDTATALAKHYDADLWLLGFASQPTVGTDARGLCRYVWDGSARRAQTRLWDFVLQARERHYRTFPLFVGEAYNTQEVIRTAKRLMADLIVVPVTETSRRFGSLEEVQADELLRRSATPVLVAVPQGSRNEKDKKESWK
ncbi:MAG: universal stress protein [Verrucomicrobia bacterium]|nr:universal stress protein [Verrucomicrobiota bacterium]